MLKILLVIILVGLSLGALKVWIGGGYDREEAKNQCVTEIRQASSGTYMQSADAEGYCACLTDDNEAENKVELIDTVLRQCFDQYMKPSVISFCKQKDEETRAAGWRLNCECFAGKVTDIFIEKEKAPNGTLSQHAQNELIQRGFLACARR